MTLDEYLRQQKAENGLTEIEFGRRAGLSQAQVNRLRQGQSWLSHDVAARITMVTEGQVTANDFVRKTDQVPEKAA